MINTIPSVRIAGIEKIFYKMPRKDIAGNLTGEYQTGIKAKTVYDPQKISTETYLQWGLEAANNALKRAKTKSLGREWSGMDNQGVSWHGYCDAEGKIISFFPED